jgi:hypothetical protein
MTKAKVFTFLQDLAIIGLMCVGFSSVSGCLATSGDIERIEAAQRNLESVLADENATSEDLEAAMKLYGDELRAVRDQIEERGKSIVDDLSDPSNWGPAGIASILLHLYRDRRRKLGTAPADEATKASGGGSAS